MGSDLFEPTPPASHNGFHLISVFSLLIYVSPFVLIKHSSQSHAREPGGEYHVLPTVL